MIIKLKEIRFLLFLLFVFSLSFPATLFAHKVYVFAWVEDGNIISESKFSSNKFVKKGKIIIQNQEKVTLLTGTTTDKGIFSFKIPKNLDSDILIILDGGMGHKAEWKLELDEIQKADKDQSNSSESEKKDKTIESPSIVDIVTGILIIFVFFIFMAYYNKKKLNKK